MNKNTVSWIVTLKTEEKYLLLILHMVIKTINIMHHKLVELQKVIRDNFSVNYLKLELFEYLSEMEDIYAVSKIDQGYEVLIFNITSNENELCRILLSDNLTILQYKTLYNYDIDLYYHVCVAIGNYQENDGGFATDKCFALFKFNKDLSLYDIEFSFNERF
ncbi:hypothetical protein DXN04_33985 [Chitinophaga silvisoli]|uniref:Uncharacterized protein n=2 Tax=Chitinophaga silvisoli TaxID=2291814 RepID=A0A3E1NMY1_9BACT|nr:hypothetical protein DXN04_33985 [Chitinophaga silvisoli]